MKILVTGANSPLGKLINKEKTNFEDCNIYFASSKPNRNQLKFTFKEGLQSFPEYRFDLVIHLAHPSNYQDDIIKSEITVLNKFVEKGIKIVNVASLSGCLTKPNAYGKYKREIEKWCMLNGQINIRCGLLFGGDYQGQIHKLKKFLSIFPFTIQSEIDGKIFLTPSKIFLGVIREIVVGKNHDNDIILSSDVPKTTNEILRNLSTRKKFRVNISNKFMNSILKLNLKSKYFNYDRYLGFIGSYNKACLGNKYLMLDSDLNREWSTYVKSIR